MHIIIVLLNSEDGSVQVVPSEGLDLGTARNALSVALSGITEREIRERIERELAEKAAQTPVSANGSEPPVLDG